MHLRVRHPLQSCATVPTGRFGGRWTCASPGASTVAVVRYSTQNSAPTVRRSSLRDDCLREDCRGVGEGGHCEHRRAQALDSFNPEFLAEGTAMRTCRIRKGFDWWSHRRRRCCRSCRSGLHLCELGADGTGSSPQMCGAPNCRSRSPMRC